MNHLNPAVVHLVATLWMTGQVKRPIKCEFFAGLFNSVRHLLPAGSFAGSLKHQHGVQTLSWHQSVQRIKIYSCLEDIQSIWYSTWVLSQAKVISLKCQRQINNLQLTTLQYTKTKKITGHFRVALNLIVKARLSAKFLLRKLVFIQMHLQN